MNKIVKQHMEKKKKKSIILFINKQLEKKKLNKIVIFP
jgi:hypothetical protein